MRRRGSDGPIPFGSKAPWIFFMNALLVFIPISGLFFISLNNSQALRQRTMYLTRFNNGLVGAINYASSEEAIHSLPILAPYQRAIVVSKGFIADSGWRPNGEFEQPNPVYSLAAAALAKKYPPPALGRDEILERLSGYVDAGIKKTGIIDFRFMYSVLPFARDDDISGSSILLFDKSDIMMANSLNKAALLLISVFSGTIALFISALYFRMFVKPLSELAREARSLGGREASSADIFPLRGRGDEIGQLSLALYQSATELIRRKEAVESFAADVLHELKNPLTAIRNGVEILEKENEAEGGAETSEILKIISRESGRIERLLFDIKELSAFEDRPRSAESCEPVETIRETASLYGERGVRVEIDEGSPFPVGMPREELARILRNLLDNAVDFSPGFGSVAIALRREGDSAVLSVSDSGKGIPDGEKDKIFGRFYSNRSGRETSGLHSGLGLSIVARIIQSHGYSIRCFDNSPTGSIFEIRFRIPHT
jgi:signal transduction histidine kinase